MKIGDRVRLEFTGTVRRIDAAGNCLVQFDGEDFAGVVASHRLTPAPLPTSGPGADWNALLKGNPS